VHRFKGQMVRGDLERPRNECVKVDIKRLDLVKNEAHNQDMWKSLTSGNRPTLPHCGNESVILYRLRSRYVKSQ